MEPQMENNIPSKSNSILWVILVLILLVAGGYYFYSQRNSNETGNTEKAAQSGQEATFTNDDVAAKVGASKSVEAQDYTFVKIPNEGMQYENEKYRFSFMVPTSWGIPVVKEVNGGEGTKILTHITLSAENDTNRFFQVQVVKSEDKLDPSVTDYPQTALKESAAYAFYYTSSANTADKEISKIAATFRIF